MLSHAQLASLALTLAAVGACAHHPADDVHPATATTAAPPGPTIEPAVAEAGAGATDAPAPEPAPVDASAPLDASPAKSITWETTGSNYPGAGLKDTFTKHADKLEACFKPGLKKNPKLRGRVIVRFTIGTDGKPKGAVNQGSNLEDEGVIACVVKVVKALRFPPTVEGTATVIYPFIFHPYEPFLILPDSAPPPGQ